MVDRVDDTLLFIVEWFDPLPQLTKKYSLKYFSDNSVEMIDIKSKKLFLKKSPCPDTVSREDFYVGAKILLYSRELDIIDYGDNKTRQRLQYQLQFVTIVLSSKLYSAWGKIVDEFLNIYNITKMRSFLGSSNVLESINTALSVSNRQTSLLADGVNVALVGSAEDGFTRVHDFINKVKHALGSDSILFSSNGQESNELQSILFNNKSVPSTVTLDNSTCVIIKPHAVKSKLVGVILDQIISQGYDVSAIKSVNFDKIEAEEFLEVYKGVVPDYADHVIQLTSGLTIALEVRAENPVQTFRSTAGPWDTSMAKELYPESIRGKYGLDNIRNAIHCTDLPEDAQLECEYIFSILE